MRLDQAPTLNSLSVWNLEFASKEEDFRVFFEGLRDLEDQERQRKPLTWITRVRIVRDKDTQLG